MSLNLHLNPNKSLFFDRNHWIADQLIAMEVI